MEGSSSVMMGFGENNNNSGIYPMTMMPAFMNSSTLNNPNQDTTNSFFFPMPCTSNHDPNPNNLNTNTNNNTGLGQYFMEDQINHNINKDGSSSTSAAAVKAKIMTHPHYQRLLAAYVNCQKVRKKIKKLNLDSTHDIKEREKSREIVIRMMLIF